MIPEFGWGGPAGAATMSLIWWEQHMFPPKTTWETPMYLPMMYNIPRTQTTTMVSLQFFLASALLGAGVGASKSTAFLSPRPRPIIRTNENRVGALAENGEGGIVDLDTFLSSLPSPLARGRE